MAAAETRPFDVVYERVGAFDTLDDPRVVWIGLEDGFGSMERLAAILDRGESRPLVPHLTLGRRRDARASSEFTQALRAEPVLGLRRRVDAVSLYASRPASFGRVYEIIATAAFG